MNDIDQRVNAFIPAALTLLEEKTDSAADLAQEKLNAVWDIVFSLPVYRDLKMDEECNYHYIYAALSNRIFLPTDENMAAVKEHRKLVIGVCVNSFDAI